MVGGLSLDKINEHANPVSSYVCFQTGDRSEIAQKFPTQSIEEWSVIVE
jgi:hypothetical protein